MALKKKSLLFLGKKDIKNQHAIGEPETADEYLEAGVAFEEAGEKWRAGDAAKSLRFFIRAVDKYDAGLQSFPNSFDLAYNKARLQYDVSQQPRLFEQLPTPLIDLLRISADSHLYALRLDDSNADNLFNLAQVYSSLAEAVIDQDGDFRSKRVDARKLLHESLGFLDRCLRIQEAQYAQVQQDQVSEQDDLDDRDSVRSVPSETREEIWASVEELVTANTLLDTSLAQLETLKTLCGLQTSDTTSDITLIEQYYQTNMSSKFHIFDQNPERKLEMTLSKAGFLGSFATARYRLGITDLSTFEHDFDISITEAESQINADAPGLCMTSEAHIELNSSIEERLRLENKSLSPEELTRTCNIRWKHITRALDQYTTASKLANAPNLARIQISRGDCELLRRRLAEAPFHYSMARKNTNTLVKNASVYYGAAIKVLAQDQASAQVGDDRAEVDVKAAVAAAWSAADAEMLRGFLRSKGPDVQQRLEDMRDQGLLGDESWAEIQGILK